MTKVDENHEISQFNVILHKIHQNHVEEIKTFRFAISSIYLLKNIFVDLFGEKFAENDHFPL